MKAAQFKQILSSEAFNKEQRFHDAELAKQFGLAPFLKVWAPYGGVDGFVSQFYQDQNEDIVYAVNLCEATMFFKLEIAENKAIIHQVGFGRTYEAPYECAVRMTKFSEHDCSEGWHIGFDGFETFVDALSIEAQATEQAHITQAISAFYEKNERDEYEENYSLYFPHLLKFYGTVDNTYRPSVENNGKAVGEITL